MKPQASKILTYMQDFGEITPLDAMREFGCMRLAARISDLRREGYNISKRTVAGTNRYGDKTHFAAYRLEVTA